MDDVADEADEADVADLTDLADLADVIHNRDMTCASADWDPLFPRIFGRLVRGCINTDFRDQIRVLKRLTRSTH